LSTALKEATLKDICEELSKRNLNFVLLANYYDSRREEQQPVMSFGVRKQDLAQAIGIIEVAKAYLIEEFNTDNDVNYMDDDEENDEETPF